MVGCICTASAVGWAAQSRKQRPHPSVHIGIVHVNGPQVSQVARFACSAKDARVRIGADGAEANLAGFQRKRARAQLDGFECEHAQRYAKTRQRSPTIPSRRPCARHPNVARPNHDVTLRLGWRGSPVVACRCRRIGRSTSWLALSWPLSHRSPLARRFCCFPVAIDWSTLQTSPDGMGAGQVWDNESVRSVVESEQRGARCRRTPAD